MKTIQMQRVILLCLVSTVLPITAHAQKIAIGKYQTKEPLDKVFVAAMRATPLVKFAVKSTDKDQGTIQAVRSAHGKEFASLFVMIRREDNNVVVEATFTRNPGFMGGGNPDKWAKEFGDELKSELPDLTVSVTRREK